jgi:hypothetical protein
MWRGAAPLSCFDQSRRLCINSSVRKLHFILVGVLACCLLAGLTRAATFQLTGGQTLTGEPTSPNEKGVLIRLEDGSFSERTAWEKFSQDDLKKMAAANPKLIAFVEQYLEPSTEEKQAAEKAAIVIKTDYSRLDRPAAKSFFKGLFSTGVGVVALLLIYVANIYASYEISIFRARPPGLVCGVSAVAPFLGPIIFLSMPTLIESKEDIVQEPMREKEAYHVGEVLPEAEAVDPQSPEAQAAAQAAALPPTRTFPRGQYTFNRRFFETNFPGFFTVVRREADRDLVLHFKSARGEYTVQRITRVGPNELHLQVQKGHVSEEVMIPFLEVQEVVLKHKDA